MWTVGLKIAKSGKFWYKFSPKEIYLLIRFVQIFAWGMASQDYTSTPYLTIVALKMRPYGPQNRQKMVIFGKNLPLEENFGGR